jgi:pantoate--beta-alanine ligase
MKIISTINELRTDLEERRQKNHNVVFVPTMGNLHEGHLQLLRKAHQHGNCIVVSIFVNPLQFAPTEDFANYPRTLKEDLKKLQNLAVDILFTPEVTTIYPAQESQSQVFVPKISSDLCGIFRPHFFKGVTTIVAKLFNIVQPDIALFGEKDFQQLIIIRKMVTDLAFPIEIISVPTQRESDGLAMSSRNQYLDLAERKKAVTLYQTLCYMRDAIQNGNTNYEQLMIEADDSLTHVGFKVDYVSVRHRVDLSIPTSNDKELVILTAAWMGKARLLDNIFVDV